MLKTFKILGLIILGFILATIFYFPKGAGWASVPFGPGDKSNIFEKNCFGLMVRPENQIPEGAYLLCLGIPYGQKGK